MTRHRIAVVEDNPDNRLLLQALLEDRYDIDEYEDGPSALAGLAAAAPALVLLDISLPGMDGSEVLRRIRALPGLVRPPRDRPDGTCDVRRPREVPGGGVRRIRHQADHRRGPPLLGDPGAARPEVTIPSRRPTRLVTYAGFGLAVALLGVAGTVSWRTQQAYQEGVEWTRHTYEVLDLTQQLSFAMQQAEAGGRGYALTGLPGLKREVGRNLARVPPLIDSLGTLVRDNRLQRLRLDSLAPVVAVRIDLLDRLMRLRDAEGRISAEMSSLVAQGEQHSAHIRRVLGAFSAEERRYLSDRESATEERGLVALFTVAAAMILALLILGAATSVTLQELAERVRAERMIQHEAERQAVMIQLQQAIATATSDDPAVLDLIVDQVMALTSAAGAALTFVDGDVHVARTARGDLVPWVGIRNPLANSLTGDVLRRREPEVIADVLLDPRVDRSIAEKLGTRSTAILPILSGDAAVGSLVVSSKAPDAFSADDLTALRIMSGILSAGVTNAAAFAANERLLAELRRSRDAAEEASRTKSEFLATMSHELRTPLNSVIGFANLLKKNRAGNLSDQDLQYLGRISDNGTHLLGLINDILDVSKIEAGKMEVRPVPTDLAPLIRETVSQLGGQATERHVELRAETPPGLGSVEVDPARLKQVLINLIGNGLKFTEQGSITVRLVADGAGRPTRIDVVDTGIGIPADRLEAIFDAFTQAETTTERRFGGTGLGLTISRSLLRLMGADLKVTSVVGAGSTFSIVLPKGSAEAEAGVGGAGPLILVVDDDVHTRQLLSAILDVEGYRSTTAHDGRDALAALGTEFPRLILLDLKMPVMNGRDFLKALRGDPRYAEVPVVVVTSLDLDDPELEGISAEVNAVMSKGPALEQALPDLIRTLLGS